MPKSAAPQCQFCGQFPGENDSVKVDAIAIAPQIREHGEYHWVPVCANHLNGWYIDCPESMPPPFAVGDKLDKTNYGGNTMSKHVRKYLDLSTGHMTHRDNELLATVNKEDALCGLDLPLVRPFEYGNFVWVPDTEDRDQYESGYAKYGFSPEFIGVLRYARENGCDWVNFDRDADTCEDLPTFNW